MSRSALVFPVVLLATLFAGEAYGQCIDLDPYVNMTTGRTLLYMDFDTDGSGGLIPDPDDLHVETVVDIDIPSGLKGEVTIPLPSGIPDHITLWQLLADGHHYFGGSDLPSSGVTIAYPPPGPIDGCMDVGETVVMDYWEIIGGVPDHQRRVEYTLVATGLSFDTPAGSFDDCALIMMDHYENEVFRGRDYWVLALGVGQIISMSHEWQSGVGLVPEDMDLCIGIF